MNRTELAVMKASLRYLRGDWMTDELGKELEKEQVDDVKVIARNLKKNRLKVKGKSHEFINLQGSYLQSVIRYYIILQENWKLKKEIKPFKQLVKSVIEINEMMKGVNNDTVN